MATNGFSLSPLVTRKANGTGSRRASCRLPSHAGQQQLPGLRLVVAMQWGISLLDSQLRNSAPGVWRQDHFRPFCPRPGTSPALSISTPSLAGLLKERNSGRLDERPTHRRPADARGRHLVVAFESGLSWHQSATGQPMARGYNLRRASPLRHSVPSGLTAYSSTPDGTVLLLQSHG